MNYIMIVVGLLLIGTGTRLAADGAQSGWNAGISGVPIFFGALLVATGVTLYIYERYVEK